MSSRAGVERFRVKFGVKYTQTTKKSSFVFTKMLIRPLFQKKSLRQRLLVTNSSCRENLFPTLTGGKYLHEGFNNVGQRGF